MDFGADGRADRPLVDLIYFDAGGGHRASAMALQAIIEGQGRPWRLRLINLGEVLGHLDFLRRTTGVSVENFYNAMLRHNLTMAVGPMVPIMHKLIRLFHSREVERLARFWRQPRPALVVSLIPHFNRAIFEGLRAADAARDGVPTPMVTILTDLADYPPHFWIERQKQFFICGTAFSAQQVLAMGCPSERIFLTSGMIVRPDFYRVGGINRRQELSRLGLRDDVPTGLVMFGGCGSGRMVTIAERLATADLKLQLLFLCGDNQRLRERLLTMKLPFAHRVEGFTLNVPSYMSLADFFIGKAGPGSISEALVTGLPVVVERNRSTMVQERFNTEWVSQHEVGVVLSSFAAIAPGIRPMLEPEHLGRFRRRVGALNNRAIFEIPEIFDGLISRGRTPGRPKGSFGSPRPGWLRAGHHETNHGVDKSGIEERYGRTTQRHQGN